MKYPKRSQYKYAKSRYRVRNWAEYEAGLKKRGNLTVWLSDAALDAWKAPIPDHTTLSRRLQKLGPIKFRGLATDRPIHLLIDSTGLRIHVGQLTVPGYRP
jgi:hypothetical protein